MKNKPITILLLMTIVVFLETSYIAGKSILNIGKSSKVRGGNINRQLSEEYVNQGLYDKAVDSYEKYLLEPALAADRKANVSYIIGNIYMENLSDYKNALASFIRAKVFKPDSANISEINKKIVICLERLGKSLDAERELSKITSVNKEKETAAVPKSEEQGIIVAKIGERDITMSELNSELDKLPQYIRDEYKNDEAKKLEFLQQYVAGELLYDSAKRRGYEDEKDIISALYRAKKQMMIEKVINEEVKSKITEPTDMDLKLYYNAHKDNYTEEIKDDKGNITKRQKDLSEVKDRVKSEYMTDKQQEQMNTLINGLIRTEDVQIYGDLFKKKEKGKE